MQPSQLPGTFYYPPTLVDLLRNRAVKQGPDRAFTYLVDGETEEVHLTYEELDRQARAIGAWLTSLGMEGQRALLLYPAGMEFVAAFFGCLYAGAIAVPAYPPRLNRSLARIQAIADDAEAKVAMTTQAVLERVQPLLEQTPDLKKVRWVATDRAPAGIENDWRSPAIAGDTLAFLQYTSGSTGTPKGVMLNHANLMHNSALISYAFEHTRSGTGVFWLPSYHDMGLIGGILQPLYVGRPNVLMSPMTFLQKPFRWLSAISRYRGTTSGGPNFAYDLCVRKITPEQRDSLDLSSWDVAFNGAEPIHAETLERFAEIFEPCGFRREAFYPCFGLAEATLIVSGGFKRDPPVVRAFDAESLENHQVVDAEPGADGARELVGCGRTLPDQQIVIADPETLDRCLEGRVGEIWAAGPSIAQGYWNRADESRETFQAHLHDSGEGPFLRTGDLGFLVDGELFVTGRIKDLIIVRGLNHYPQDIELTVEKSHPRLRAGCGAAFTVTVGGREQLVIVQEVERRKQRDLEPVFEAIRREVADEHELLIDAIVLVRAGTIPKTSSGKIQRHACRAGFLNDSLQVVAEWRKPDDEAPGRTAAPRAAARATAERTPARAALSARNGNGVAKKGPSTTDLVLEQVRKIAKERADGLTMDSTLADAGLDSLERMEILASLEERFGGRLPEEILPELETCRQVVEAVEKYLGKEPRPKAARPADQEIPESWYRFDQIPEYLRLKQGMQAYEAAGMSNPYFSVHEGLTNDTTVVRGRRLISYSSYNYVGMSGDPVVVAAAKAAIDRFGTSVSASRLVSGEKTIHLELERAISDFIGVEDTIVYVGGHATNESTIGHLFGPGDLVLHDGLAHNSIVQGGILSGARRRAFAHNDWQAADRLLSEFRHEYRRVLIAIEGVYSMDGDFPDLPRFIELKKRHQAFLMIDEAHSIGVLGETGRGIGERFGVNRSDVDLWMGTLSKAFGSCGGYIGGCKEVVEYLKYTAPGFVFSNGISPPNTAAALAAVRLLAQQPERVERLRQRAKLFLTLAKERGLNTGMSRDSAVVPVILGNSLNCLRLSRALFERGVNVQPILYPAVEESASRLRFFLTSLHSEEQIRYTVSAMAEELEKIHAAEAEASQPAASAKE